MAKNGHAGSGTLLFETIRTVFLLIGERKYRL